MEPIFITITGQDQYLGLKPFKVGRVVKLVKDRDNEFDEDAIRVELPFIDTIGYVANSTSTVYKGTFSAGRLYDKMGEEAFAQILFITHSGAIARILPPTEEEERDDCFEVESVSEEIGEGLKPSDTKNKIGFC